MKDTLVAMKETNDAKSAKYEVTVERYREARFQNVSVQGLWIRALCVMFNDAIKISRVLDFEGNEIDLINRMVVEFSHAS